jgi:hypothetical protein
MIAYRTKTRLWSTPPLGSQVDWSHPLASGLVGCWLLNERGGSQVFDLVNRTALAVLGGAVLGPTGLVINGAGQMAAGPTPRGLMVPLPLTVVWQGTQLGPPSGESNIFGVRPHAGNTTPFTSYVLGYDSSTPPKLVFFSNDGTSFITSTTATGASALISPSGRFQCAATIGRGSSSQAAKLYSGGTLIDSTTFFITSIAYASDSVIGFGEPSSGQTDYPNSRAELAYIFDLEQPQSNLQWLAAEPYGFILPPMATRYVFLAGSVSVSASPSASSAAWSAASPSVNAGGSATPAASSAAWSAASPTVATSASASASPSASSSAWSAGSPAVSIAVDASASPASSSAAWSAGTPTIATSSSITPPPAVATWATGTWDADFAVGPEDLIEAIQRYLEALMVPSLVTWVGAGQLPPGYGLPFVAIGDPDETIDAQEDGSDHPPFDDEGMVAIRTIAATREQAKALSKTCAARYPVGLTLAPLTFLDGQLQMIRRVSRGAPVLEDEHAAAGDQVWVAHLMFATITSKNL